MQDKDQFANQQYKYLVKMNSEAAETTDADLSRTVEDLERKMVKKQKVIDSLQLMNDQLNNLNNGFRLDRDRMQADLERLNQEVTLQRGRAYELRVETIKLRTEIDALNMNSSQTGSQIKDIIVELQNQDELIKLRDELKAETEISRQLKDQNRKLKTDLEDLTISFQPADTLFKDSADGSQREELIQSAFKICDPETEEEIRSLKLQNQKLEGKIQSLRDVILDLQKAVKEYQRSSVLASDEYDELLLSVTEQKCQNEVLREEAGKSCEKCSQLLSQLQSIKLDKVAESIKLKKLAEEAVKPCERCSQLLSELESLKLKEVEESIKLKELAEEVMKPCERCPNLLSQLQSIRLEELIARASCTEEGGAINMPTKNNQCIQLPKDYETRTQTETPKRDAEEDKEDVKKVAKEVVKEVAYEVAYKVAEQEPIPMINRFLELIHEANETIETTKAPKNEIYQQKLFVRNLLKTVIDQGLT